MHDAFFFLCMSELIIRHRQGVIKLPLPYFIYINGQLIGYMRGDEIRGSLPAGKYLVEIRLPLRLLRWDVSLSACAQLEINEHETLTLIFRDRERWWDILFTIDLIFYLFSFFVTIPKEDALFLTCSSVRSGARSSPISYRFMA